MNERPQLEADGAWQLDRDGAGRIRAARFRWVARAADARRRTVEGLAGRPVPEREWEAVLVEAFFGLDEVRHLGVLELHLRDLDATLARAVASLASRTYPDLTNLVIAAHPFDPAWAEPIPVRVPAATVDALANALPGLVTLHLRGHSLLSHLSHPTLRTLSVAGYRAVAGMGVDEPSTNVLPGLRELSIALDRRTVGFVTDPRPSLGLDPLPPLRRLDLRGWTGWFDPRTRGASSLAGLLDRHAQGLAGSLEWLGLAALRAVDAAHVEGWRQRFVKLRALAVDQVDPGAREAVATFGPGLTVGRRAPVWVDTIEAGTARDRLARRQSDVAGEVADLVAACGDDLPALRELADLLPDDRRAMVANALALRTAAFRTALATASLTDRRAVVAAATPKDPLPNGAWARLGRLRNVPSPLVAPSSTGRFEPPDDGVEARAVAGSADGRFGARAGGDGQITVWDVATGDRRTDIGTPQPVTALAFSADDWLLAGREDGTVAVWDWARRHRIAVFRGHRGPIAALAASRDGRWAASTDRPAHGAARTLVFDLGRLVPTATLEGDDAPSSRGTLQFAHGRLEATWRHEVRRYAPETGEKRRTLERLRAVDAIAVSPDGARLATAPDVTLWDLTTLAPIVRLGDGGARRGAVSWSPDGRHLAAIVDRRPLVFDRDGRPIVAPEIETAGLDLAFAPDGSLVVATEAGVGCFGVPSGAQRWWTATTVRGARLAVSNRSVAFGAHATALDILGLGDGTLAHRLRSPDEGGLPPTLDSIEFDGATVVASSGPPYDRTWCYSSDGTVRSPLAEPDGTLVGGSALAWSQDHRRMAVAGTSERTLRVYDVDGASARCTATFEVPGGHEIEAVAWAPDGTSVASAGRDAVVLLWPVEATPRG